MNITLEGSQSIKKAKRHDLVFEIEVLGPESNLLLIIFTSFHLMIGIGEI